MYGKIFHSIYDGTLAEDWRALITFQQLIVLCDADGVVDMTPESISRRTGIPLEHIEAGITILIAPDPSSRSSESQGKRLLPLNPDRDWGWEIVNHKHYRDLRTAEDRREYMRNYMKEKRSKQKLTKANESKQLTKLANTNTDTHSNTETNADTTNMPSKLDAEVGILNFLIKRSGKSFKHVPSNLKLITARLKEGHSEAEILAVVEMKTKEWGKDPKMAKYIRPATLFNAEKFNQYVGELGIETPEEADQRKIQEWIGQGEVHEH